MLENIFSVRAQWIEYVLLDPGAQGLNHGSGVIFLKYIIHDTDLLSFSALVRVIVDSANVQ